MVVFVQPATSGPASLIHFTQTSSSPLIKNILLQGNQILSHDGGNSSKTSNNTFVKGNVITGTNATSKSGIRLSLGQLRALAGTQVANNTLYNVKTGISMALALPTRLSKRSASTRTLSR